VIEYRASAEHVEPAQLRGMGIRDRSAL